MRLTANPRERPCWAPWVDTLLTVDLNGDAGLSSLAPASPRVDAQIAVERR